MSCCAASPRQAQPAQAPRGHAAVQLAAPATCHTSARRSRLPRPAGAGAARRPDGVAPGAPPPPPPRAAPRRWWCCTAAPASPSPPPPPPPRTRASRSTSGRVRGGGWRLGRCRLPFTAARAAPPGCGGRPPRLAAAAAPAPGARALARRRVGQQRRHALLAGGAQRVPQVVRECAHGRYRADLPRQEGRCWAAAAAALGGMCWGHGSGAAAAWVAGGSRHGSGAAGPLGCRLPGVSTGGAGSARRCWGRGRG
jgi:hypothetical protein